eukprot:4962521-Prymnesium_polylepis.1
MFQYPSAAAIAKAANLANFETIKVSNTTFTSLWKKLRVLKPSLNAEAKGVVISNAKWFDYYMWLYAIHANAVSMLSGVDPDTLVLEENKAAQSFTPEDYCTGSSGECTLTNLLSFTWNSTNPDAPSYYWVNFIAGGVAAQVLA